MKHHQHNSKKFFRLIKSEVKILQRLIRRRVYIALKLEKEVVDKFHRIFYDSRIFSNILIYGAIHFGRHQGSKMPFGSLDISGDYF